jgi:hypothetical protein
MSSVYNTYVNTKLLILDSPLQEVWLMQNVQEERWKTLCLQASTEKDPEKLLELVIEINFLLEQKRANAKQVGTAT